MVKHSRNYWMVEKVEAMRRARNAKFYANASDMSDWGRKNFLETRDQYVQMAREFNRRMVLAGINGAA